MSKRSLKQAEIKPYKDLADGLPVLGFYLAIVIIVVALIIAAVMMQAPVAQGHEVGWV